MIDGLGHRTKYKYDDAGRRTETDYADGSTDTAQYDSYGNRIQSKDRDGLFTSYHYDPQNRVSSTNYPD